MDTITVRAVSYCRISHDLAGLEAGVDRQRIDTDRLALDRGWTLVERVVDNERSASRYAKKGREGWAQIMEMIDRREVDALVAYDLDRLTRQPKELERLIDAAENGLRVVTASGMLDLATDGGRLIARMLCSVAAHEADRIRSRITTKLRHDAETGKPHWVRRPFGYTMRDPLDPSSATGNVVEAERVWVQRMYEWCIEGDSPNKIARRLNDANVIQATGAPWTSNGVRKLILASRNIAMRSHKGKVVGPAQWAPLVNVELYDAAGIALAARNTGELNRGKRSMFTGFLRCGRCGSKMVRNNSAASAAWLCAKGGSGSRGCNGLWIKAAPVDEFVLELVLVHIGAAKIATTKANPSGVARVDELQHDLAELAAMVAAGSLSMKDYKTMHTGLSARLSAAENELAQTDVHNALARMAGDVATLAERWPDLDLELQRRIISGVIEHVVIHPSTAPGRPKVNLDRVEVIWKA